MSLATGLVLLFISLGLTFGLFVLYGKLLEPDPIRVEEGSTLVLDLSMTLTDGPVKQDFAESLAEAAEALQGEEGPQRFTLLRLLQTIEAAAEDPRIAALYIEGSFLEGQSNVGFAGLEEVREALQTFRDTGKPVVAYAVAPTIADMFVLSKASELHLDPFGVVVFNGLGLELTFLGDFLEKYGVGVQVARAGSYKSAGETFTRNALSPENREQLNDLLQSAWREVLAGLGGDLSIVPEDLQASADSNPILDPVEAKQLGLVTNISYKDEVIARLKEIGTVDDDDDLEALSAGRYRSYLRQQEREASSGDDDDSLEIAIVYVQGALGMDDGDGQAVNGVEMARELRKLRDDENVKAVVLRVNSPGGGVFPSEAIQREVRRLAQVKTVVVSMGRVAASGGYWISTHADHIFAESTTITGSIGVFALIPNFETLANEQGVTFDGVETAPFADLFSVTQPKSEDEMAIFQQYIDETYEAFLQRVADGRSLPLSEVRELAEGRVWSGVDARRNGLVDEIGGLRQAIAEAADRANLTDFKLRQVPDYKSFFEAFQDSLQGQSAQALATEVAASMEASGAAHTLPALPSGRLGQQAQRLMQMLRELDSFDDPMNAYMRLPFFFDIR